MSLNWTEKKTIMPLNSLTSIREHHNQWEQFFLHLAYSYLRKLCLRI